jgi:hypothetical protein
VVDGLRFSVNNNVVAVVPSLAEFLKQEQCKNVGDITATVFPLKTNRLNVERGPHQIQLLFRILSARQSESELFSFQLNRQTRTIDAYLAAL